ncbi:MAG: ACT domain-containing protein [Verrucomicrobia bacterium]|nr:ACT domain-containing protein [Verrucomicrobiota bacterium]
MSRKFDCRTSSGTQLSVFLENRPGTLAEVAESLGGSGVNILALSQMEGINHGYVRMVVDDPAKGKAVLEKAGHLVLERRVILLEAPNEPGCMAYVTRNLADAGVNVEYAYCAVGPSEKNGLIVIFCSDPERALSVLG